MADVKEEYVVADAAVIRVSGVVARLITRGAVVQVSLLSPITRQTSRQEFTAWGLEGLAVGDGVTVVGNFSGGTREYKGKHYASLNINDAVLESHIPGAFPEFAEHQARLAESRAARAAAPAGVGVAAGAGVPF